MSHFVDMHCHLCFGIDDGPRTLDEAIEMCELAVVRGTTAVVGLAHLHPQWPMSTRGRILDRLTTLIKELEDREIHLEITPASEVLIQPDLLDQLASGELLTVGDQGKYLLVELPPAIAIDVSGLFKQMISIGVCPVLVHPERHPFLLDDQKEIEKLIHAGGIMQINASSIVGESNSRLGKIRSLFERQMVHVVGSDGHRINKRRPTMDQAFEVVVDWIGSEKACEVFFQNGRKIVDGVRLTVPKILPIKKRFWFF